jgi:hypothetical protein
MFHFLKINIERVATVKFYGYDNTLIFKFQENLKKGKKKGAEPSACPLC